ncbi:MAG: NACHT domain-containing protein [Caldilinea sp. CFX5]|nr:NACHT domain-containing protein [Caldilinea sp. CFX5]
MNLTEFGKQLQALRKARQWSQEALIEALDQLARTGPPAEYRVIDGTLLSRWERAHSQKGRHWKPTHTYMLHLIHLFAPQLDLTGAIAWAAQAGYQINPAEVQAWFAVPTAAAQLAGADAQPAPTNGAPGIAPSTPPHNLPTMLTSFVGRAEEMARLLAYLAAPATRLITIVGEGGVGKTRLALQVAHAVVNQPNDAFADGVYFFALIGISTTGLVVNGLANTLGVALAGAVDPEQQLLAALQKRRLLLLLDNVEHLVAEIGPLLTAILQAAPGVHLLVTSRERLNLAEEWVLAVTGLPFPTVQPTPGQARQGALALPALTMTEAYAAIDLFLARAQQADDHFDPGNDPVQAAAIARICTLVQGIPLGLEMAAAWVHMLSCVEIGDEIARNLDFLTSPHRNLPARQRSMRAVFEYSWQLLTAPEQAVLAALAVFQGGFTREAATSVVKSSLVTLRSLVDKSLLKVTAGRYELHELLRQFAQEKLQADADRDQAVQECHAQYYGGFLQQLEPLLHSAQEQSAVTQIKEEIHNIRSGWHWAVAHQRVVILEQYIPSFTPFYSMVNWFREGKSTFGVARTSLTKTLQLNTYPEPGIQQCLAKVMVRESLFDHFLGQPDQAVQLLQESLKSLQQYPDDKEICLAYHTLGIIAYNQGDYQASFQYLHQSFERHTNIDDPPLKASLCVHLGQVEMAVGNYHKAKHWYQAGLKIYQRLEKNWGIANALLNLAKVAEFLDEEAEQLYEQSLRLFAELGNRTGIALCNNHLGVIAQKRADYSLARARHQQSLTIYQENGEKTGLIRTLNHLFDVACAQGEEISAQEYLRTAFELSKEINAKPLLLQNLVGVVKLLSNKLQSLTTESNSDKRALSDSSVKAIFLLLSLVAKHPASDYQTRHQAQMQLSALTTQLPAYTIDQLQEQIQSTPLGASIMNMLPQELADTSFLKSTALSLARTFTTDLKLLEQKRGVEDVK